MPRDFEHFLKLLGESRRRVKQRGKTISIKPPNGTDKFFRFRTCSNGLPDGCDEKSLRKKIADIWIDVEMSSRDDVLVIVPATLTTLTIDDKIPMVEAKTSPKFADQKADPQPQSQLNILKCYRRSTLSTICI